jgi:vacuolar-type H+-ATPase subunit I/STV1
MNAIHQPDPEFVGRLEGELRSTIRRHEQFHNGLSASSAVIRKLRWTTVLVALAAMCVGSAATFALTHRLRAQMADLIIAKAEARLEFANAQIELLSEEMQETESRAAAGLITPGELDDMRLQLAHVEANAAARALDVEEARITGREPDNSLSAPILRGRDFVTERLQLERARALEIVTRIDKEAARQGLDSDQAAMIAQQQEAVRAALSAVEKRLALRQDYLSGARTAREVELADMQFSVGSQRQMAGERVQELQQELERYRALFEDGLASRAEVRAVEMQFRAAVLHRDLAELDMQILEEKLADRSE